MKDEDFEDLIASVREAGSLMRKGKGKDLRKAILTGGKDKGQEVLVHTIQPEGNLAEGIEPHVVVEYPDGHMDFCGVHWVRFLESPHD